MRFYDSDGKMTITDIRSLTDLESHMASHNISGGELKMFAREFESLSGGQKDLDVRRFVNYILAGGAKKKKKNCRFNNKTKRCSRQDGKRTKSDKSKCQNPRKARCKMTKKYRTSKNRKKKKTTTRCKPTCNSAPNMVINLTKYVI